jgi:hypothetical protein
MHTATRLRFAGAIGVAAISRLAGCGSSSKSSSTDSSSTTAATTDTKAAFCADNDAITKALSGITSADQAIPALKANITTIDKFGKDAPDAVKADAKLMVDGVHTAIEKNDASGMNTPTFTAAGEKVDAFCGVSTSSSSTTAKP